MSALGRVLPEAGRRGWCPGLARPMPTGDGLLARIHPPLGILTLGQLRAVADGARRFGNGHVDVTARANLQIRGVTEATRLDLAAALEAVGLGDVRDDGGPQRLTLTSPRAGLTGALLDVPALARAIEAAGLGITGLPAKTLVLIEGGALTALPGIAADLHVRATVPGRAALGLAADDGIAWIASCDEAKTAGSIAALLRAFAETGRRRVRDLTSGERAGLARSLGDLLDRRTALSETGGFSAHDARIEGSLVGLDTRSTPLAAMAPHAAREARSGPLSQGERDGVRGVTSPVRSHPSPCPSPAKGAGPAPHAATGLIRMGADGTYTGGDSAVLELEAPFGRCTADMLDRLAEIAGVLCADEIRLSPSRGFVLPSGASTPDRRARGLAGLAAAGFVTTPDDPRRAVAACPGAPACASGSTPTGADAARLAAAFRPFAARGLTAHVSGCAKGCAHPTRADLTLVARHGRYGVVLDGAAGDGAMQELTFEAALERVRRASAAGPDALANAFRTPT